MYGGKVTTAELLTCDEHVFDKNRHFGAEKSLEPSLILAGERLNDTSCLNLRTWCQADANLLAGDVSRRRACSSRGAFFNSLALLLPLSPAALF